jgi:hypothetical protein
MQVEYEETPTTFSTSEILPPQIDAEEGQSDEEEQDDEPEEEEEDEDEQHGEGKSSVRVVSATTLASSTGTMLTIQKLRQSQGSRRKRKE